ncbi:conserved hypothetical protein [Gammaproteobacteria bacterium]
MRELPIEIDDAEKIVRAIKTPYHVNRQGNLKPSAFRPPPGKTVISVVRQMMGNDFCKNKAVEICGDAYLGLAVITASTIWAIGSQVYDERGDFIGHAHIDHGFPSPSSHEPQCAVENERMHTRCKKFADASVFHLDQSPTVPGWSGPQL